MRVDALRVHGLRRDDAGHANTQLIQGVNSRSTAPPHTHTHPRTHPPHTQAAAVDALRVYGVWRDVTGHDGPVRP
jgi:hypothetical protein